MNKKFVYQIGNNKKSYVRDKYTAQYMKINSTCAEELSQKDLKKHNNNSTYYCNSALVSREWSASRSGHYVPGVGTPSTHRASGTAGVIWEMSVRLPGI